MCVTFVKFLLFLYKLSMTILSGVSELFNSDDDEKVQSFSAGVNQHTSIQIYCQLSDHTRRACRIRMENTSDTYVDADLASLFQGMLIFL